MRSTHPDFPGHWRWRSSHLGLGATFRPGSAKSVRAPVLALSRATVVASRVRRSLRRGRVHQGSDATVGGEELLKLGATSRLRVRLAVRRITVRIATSADRGALGASILRLLLVLRGVVSVAAVLG